MGIKAPNHYNKELHLNLYKLITQWWRVKGCICTKSCNATSTVYTIFYIYVTDSKQVN